MITIRTVAIENLFDAETPVLHAFPPSRPADPSRDAPVVLHGPDLGGVGAGAALRLLFTGLSDPGSRTVGFPPKILSIEEFMFGRPALWDGMINPQVRKRDTRGSASVAAEISYFGTVVEVERRWNFDGSEFEELIRVEPASIFSEVDAAGRLARILPPALAPLFLLTGGDARDLFDDAARCRSALDVVSANPFLDRLMGAAGAVATLDDPKGRAWERMEAELAAAAASEARRQRQAEIVEARLSEYRDRLRRDLQATTQELERLAEALDITCDNRSRIGPLPDASWEKLRARWYAMGPIPPPTDGDRRPDRVFMELVWPLNCTENTGISCAERRFAEVSASVRRLERALSNVTMHLAGPWERDDERAVQSTSVPGPDRVAGRRTDDRLPAQRLVDCLADMTQAVRRKRIDQIAARLGRFEWTSGERQPFRIRLNGDGSLWLSAPDRNDLGKANLPLRQRERLGFALTEAFAFSAGHPFPVVVDDAFSHVSRESREWAIQHLFGLRDA